MVGTTAGKYRILEVIGRGSMGTVYRAQDTTLHREVAIKTLNTDVADPAAARRFRAEAVAVARLNHPRIAKVYDLFEHDGQLLMAMELVTGETLDSLVSRTGPLPPEKAAAFMSQALAALAHAHEMGVIHRDLKPANLMVADGRLKITDFGIARVAGAEHLTSVGFLMGTPAYMAPEQLLGGEVDARTDVFAIGCVLYFLATGKLPFKGETAMEIVESRLHDEPTPVRMVRSDLPQWLDQVLHRALAKDPDARFQTAAEFKDAIERGLAGLPVAPPVLQIEASGFAETVLPGTLPVISEVSRPTSAKATVGKPDGPAFAEASTSAKASADGSADKTAGKPDATGSFSETVRTPIGPAGPGGPVGPAAPAFAEATADKSVDKSAGKPAGPASTKATAGKPARRVVVIGAFATIVIAAGLGWWLWPKAAPEISTAPVAQPVETVTPVPSPEPTSTTVPVPVATPAPVPSPTALPAVAPQPTPTPSPTAGPGRGRKEDAPISFIAVKMLKVTGKKSDDVDATLTFGNGAISLAPRGDALSQLRQYDTLLAATFVKDQKPKWVPNLSAPPPDLGVPGISLFNPIRRDRNWLVLQGQTFYMILSFSDEDSPLILNAVSTRTRVKIAQPGK